MIQQTIKKDWLVYVVCLVTIISSYGYYSYVQGNLDRAISDCNDYWAEELNRAGRINLPKVPTPNYNFTNINVSIYGGNPNEEYEEE
jgi:hypothetical protein